MHKASNPSRSYCRAHSFTQSACHLVNFTAYCIRTDEILRLDQIMNQQVKYLIERSDLSHLSVIMNVSMWILQILHIRKPPSITKTDISTKIFHATCNRNVYFSFRMRAYFTIGDLFGAFRKELL